MAASGLRFLVDAQLPPGLALTLRSQSHHAQHVADVGLRDADDDEIRRYAVGHAAVVVTKDEDFADRHRLNPKALDQPVVVWLRVGNCSNRDLLRWFVPLLPDIVTRLEAGERLIEVI